MFDEFKKADDLRRRRLFCNKCGIRTIHKPRSGWEGTWSDYDNQLNGGQTFAVYQCGGCDDVCYLTSAWDSEDISWDENDEMVPAMRETQYPPPLEKGFSFDKEHTPHELDNILDELVSGYLQGNNISSTILTRVVIEYLVKDAKCTGKNLEKKIDNLLAKGLVESDQHELLQEIRKKGNKGAHESIALNASALKSGFEIISLLIDQLYNRPGRANEAVKRARRHFTPTPKQTDDSA